MSFVIKLNLRLSQHFYIYETFFFEIVKIFQCCDGIENDI